MLNKSRSSLSMLSPPFPLPFRPLSKCTSDWSSAHTRPHHTCRPLICTWSQSCYPFENQFPASGCKPFAVDWTHTSELSRRDQLSGIHFMCQKIMIGLGTISEICRCTLPLPRQNARNEPPAPSFAPPHKHLVVLTHHRPMFSC